MSESFSIHGTVDGIGVTYTREYSGIDADVMNKDDIFGAKALLEGFGWSFGAPAIAAPQSMPTGQQNAPRQQQPPFGSAWGCSIHGGQKVKAGYGGRGFECGVTTSQQPDYPARAWNGRQGETMYTCSQRSS
jgi:hypothetical protein